MAIHRLVLDTIMMKKYMAKSNVVLGRGAPHLLGGKVEPRPLKNFENSVGAENIGYNQQSFNK